MEAVEQGMVVWRARALSCVSSGLSPVLRSDRCHPIGPITLVVKCAGTRSAGNPHATCDVAGTGNGALAAFRSYRASPRPYRKIRLCPLWPHTAKILRALLGPRLEGPPEAMV